MIEAVAKQIREIREIRGEVLSGDKQMVSESPRKFSRQNSCQ